jgi:lipopolysaccharide/colanic/teichoic acid biosynthesis glycosyltransferase
MSFKRLFDLIFACAGLLLLAPAFVLAGILVWTWDRGPIFYGGERVGQEGELFRMWKFRSMILDADKVGGQLTVGGDPRITPIGRLLRKSKFDEFPQLFNVVLGEMSLVGPRPEVQKYVNLYTSEQREVLQLIPGITDPASIAFRNEEELLAASEDPEQEYINSIMPEKIRINMEYSKTASVWTDFLVILKTLFRVALPTSSRVEA